MTAPGRHTPPLPPPEVIHRCASTDGLFGGCHGATTVGVRLPADTDWPDPTEAPLAELSESMRLTRLRWEAGQVTARHRKGAPS